VTGCIHWASLCIDTSWKRQSTIGDGVVASRDRKQQPRRDVTTTARYCSVIDNRPHLAIVKHARSSSSNNNYDYYYNNSYNNNNAKAFRQSAGNFVVF